MAGTSLHVPVFIGYAAVVARIESVTELSEWRQPMLIPDGCEPNSIRPIKSQSGRIKNQSGGLDSEEITSIELSTPRRQHLDT
jgi:hypothetical protein